MKKLLLVASVLFGMNAHADQFSGLYDFKGIYEVETCEFDGIRSGEKVEIKLFNNSDLDGKGKKEFVISMSALDGYQPMFSTNFVIRKVGNDRQLLNILRERREWGCSFGNSVVTFTLNRLELRSRSRFYDLCVIPSFQKERDHKRLDLEDNKLIYTRFSVTRNKDLRCVLNKQR